MAGRDEGVYEWVAANHAHGMAQSGSAEDTIGVLTLGDESAQVLLRSSALCNKNLGMQYGSIAIATCVV